MAVAVLLLLVVCSRQEPARQIAEEHVTRLGMDVDGSWPACRFDIRYAEQQAHLTEVYRLLLEHAQGAITATKSDIEEQMETLECQWVGDGEDVTIYRYEHRPPPVSVVVEYDFGDRVIGLVQIYGGRFDGEWWPMQFLDFP